MDLPLETSRPNVSISDREWLLVNAVRQTFGIARKAPITYAEAVVLARILAPNLLSDNSPLLREFEAGLVRLYRERADAQSRLEHRIVEPVEVVDTEIRRLGKEALQGKPGQRPALESEIGKLKRLRDKFSETSWTESQAIHRDAEAFARDLPISGKGQGYTEYSLPKKRRIRVRVLHPDPPETRSGVDLIYESYYEKASKGQKPGMLVRIAAMQYKMWDGSALYTSRAPNLLPQMQKMKKAFCEEGFCNRPKSPEMSDRYRLPFCCVFVRPTDKVQTKDGWQVTHAWHVPICVAVERIETTGGGHKILRSSQIRNSATTQDTFQELYNTGMLGSRWIGVAKLRQLYKQIGIFDDLETVIVHAQEY